MPDYMQALQQPVKGLRVGVPAEYFGDGLDPEVRAAVESAIERLREAGCTILPVSLPHTRYAVPTYYLIATAEASANLARFDGVRYGFRAKDANTLGAMYRRSRDIGFGKEVKRRILLGTYALSAGYYDAYYKKAQQVRTLLTRDFLSAFQQVDVLVTPAGANAGIQAGREDRRSSGHVSGGHLYRDRQPCRDLRDIGALWGIVPGVADRRPDPGKAFRRGDGAARCPGG